VATLPSYREIAAHPALAPAIESVWMRHVGPTAASSSPDVVVPDNCSDVIARLDAETDRIDVIAVGTMSVPLLLHERSPGRYVGVRFRPGHGRRALRVDAGELRDQCVPLEDFDPALGRLIERAIRSASTARDTALALQRVVAPRLTSETGPAATVQDALARIVAARGALPLGRLCHELRVTRQHLARLFEKEVGVSPKVVARVARVRHVMYLAGRGQPVWARIAAEAGYADQSHLIAEFRTLVGSTPAEWLARRQVPDLL
jgi:AraC-like DNA-binding protein